MLCTTRQLVRVVQGWYKSVKAEGLLCMIGNLACASRSHMSRFLVSLLRHTLSCEDVTACEALAAKKFGKDARDACCECSPRVRLGDGSECCESGKTVLDAAKQSEKRAEGVQRLVAVLVLLLGHVAACGYACTGFMSP